MAYRGIVRKITANCWLTLARSSSVPHRPSRLVAWLFLAMATLVSGFGSLQAVDSVVTLTAPATQAYEADPSRYGLLKITRSNSVDPAPLTVRIDIVPTTITVIRPGPPPETVTETLPPLINANYTLSLDPDSIAKGGGFALSAAGPYSNAFDVTFPFGLSSISVRVTAIDDSLAMPRLIARFQLMTKDQSGIVVGANQVESIEIIDSSIVLQAVGLNKIIRETVPAELSNVAQGRNFGTAQLLFASDEAPFTSRYVEAMISGSAILGSDFSVTYRIGTSRVVNIASSVRFPVVPNFANAYRRSTEYGAGNINAQPAVDTTSGSGLTIAGDFPRGTARTTTTEFAVTNFTPPAGGTKVNLVIGTTTVTSWAESVVGARRIISNTIPAVPLPIREGAAVLFNYDVFVPAAGTTPASTERKSVEAFVNEPMLYPRGSTSISITANTGLRVGDLFIINGEIKRVIYAPQSGMSVAPPVTADTSPANFWIAFDPPLENPIYRSPDPTDDNVPTNRTLITHWYGNFASTGNRISWLIPALPTIIGELAPSFTGEQREVKTYLPLNAAGDIQDHIDLMFAPIDDNLIEGEKSLTLTAIVTGAVNGYTLGDPQVVDFRVGDNDVSATIEVISSPQIPEIDGALRVSLSSPFTSTNVSVPFTVRNNSTDAQYGIDYTIDGASQDSAGNVTGTVVFAPGVRSMLIPVKPKKKTPITSPLPIVVSLADSFDYVLAGMSGGNAGSNVATMNISNHSPVGSTTGGTTTTGTGGTTTSGIPDVTNSSENNGSGCGAGSALAIALLSAWLALARFRLRNR
jgi:hypothetical protein